tara:strand:+ start:596 stop:970 length:375 start_codon:yes stop_codon:yes gene_type:complete
MKDLKNILKRSVQSGFDLSFVENYNEKKLFQGLYDYLVKNHYYCSMEDGVIYVGINVVEDIAEVRIQDKTMRVKPLTDKGFFEVLVSLFKYVKHLSSFLEEMSEEDIPTETDDEDEESSEEMWL